MSAIFGVIHFNGEPAARADLARMNAALARHGGDGGGLWLEATAGLGQRLQRFTPQDACERQPLLSTDGALVLVSDARLDNRAELLRGQEPETPDSALILHAYQSWGTTCVRQLTGCYAFAVWDARTRTLFAARSPILAPALVYAATAQHFAFATMPSGLHALPFVPRALDEQALAALLVEAGGDPAATLYRGIRRLPTGHWLRADAQGMQVECFWQPDLTCTLRCGSDEEVLVAFKDLFTRVVGDHLASTTPVALQLSGGLDSAAVAATAAPLLAARGERLTAFTAVPRAGFAGPSFQRSYGDETPFVQAIAAMHPTLDLNLVRTDGQSFLAELDALFPTLEMPLRNTSNRVWIEAILDQASRRGLRIVLDGMQGNLTLSWAGSGWLSDLIRAGDWGRALGQIRGFARARGWGPAAHAVIGQGVLPLLPDPAWLAVHRLRRSGDPAAPPWRTASAIHPAFAAAQGIPELAGDRAAAKRARPDPDTRRLRYAALASQDFGAYLSAYRARYGVDMRSPTADVRIAEFCLALPEDQFLHQGTPRSLVRRAMTGQLPPRVLANPRRGVQAADWFERLVGAREQVAAELARLEQSDLARRVLDLAKLRALWERLPAGTVTPAGDDYWAYQRVLQGGLMVGAFLCWFEAGGLGQKAI